jgi:mono/diheme cytochrome c family protein
MRTRLTLLAATMLATAAAAASAGTPAQLLASLEAQLPAQGPAQRHAAAVRGEAFFTTRHGDWSCSSCHTSDPRAMGRHASTGKAIKPLAPAANPERLTDRAKVDKWLRRNCNDVLGRACSPGEQADLVSYLVSLNGSQP